MLTAIRSGLLAASALALLLLGAGGEKRMVYQRPLVDVRAILADDDELPPVFGGNDPDLRMDTAQPDAVAWVLTSDGSELMRFVARLEAESEGSTAVALTVEAPTKGPHGNVEQRLNDNPEIRDLYLAAMREQIASQLENRPYDMSRTYAALSRATAANIGSISREIKAAGEAGRRRDEDNIRKAYADEAAGQ